MQVNIVRVRFDYSCEYHEYGVRSFFPVLYISRKLITVDK